MKDKPKLVFSVSGEPWGVVLLPMTYETKEQIIARVKDMLKDLYPGERVTIKER